MRFLRDAWAWIAGAAIVASVLLAAWFERRRLVSKAKSEASWALRESERLSRVRAEKLTKADADAAQVELLGKRADALHAHAAELRAAVLSQDDAALTVTMRKAGILAAFLTLALSPSAYAQELPRDCAPEATEHRGEPLQLHGLSGWWFRGEVTRCLVAGYMEMRLLKEELSLTRTQLRLRSNQIEMLREALELSTEAELSLKRALAHSEAALEEGEGWHPLAVFGLSFAAGAAVTLAVAFALGGM